MSEKLRPRTTSECCDREVAVNWNGWPDGSRRRRPAQRLCRRASRSASVLAPVPPSKWCRCCLAEQLRSVWNRAPPALPNAVSLPSPAIRRCCWPPIQRVVARRRPARPIRRRPKAGRCPRPMMMCYPPAIDDIVASLGEHDVAPAPSDTRSFPAPARRGRRPDRRR